MAEPRLKVPAEIERALLIECGHRCCACGEGLGLEKAHIIPWKDKHEHLFEDLLVLCAVCHTRSHDEKWDRNTLRAYKEEPWVARYRSNPTPIDGKALA